LYPKISSVGSVVLDGRQVRQLEVVGNDVGILQGVGELKEKS
jgi:hypothetical protein